ncbi:hypothetical protein M422DRAFT_46181 [Sphaerobolus stellatus SS14]|nr:hypothetical protein M422DRAFT_46181 [Sphaerobolus stellatus SS14]
MVDRGSYDSANIPLSQYQYQETHTGPYGQTDPKFNESTFYAPRKKRVSPWLKFGLPILVIIIAAAVVGGVVGSRNKSSKSGSLSSSGASAGSDPLGTKTPSASEAVSAKEALGIFPTGTDSYELPIYPSTTNIAALASPTFLGSASKTTWPVDSFAPANPAPTTVRPDHPRLIAPAYKWAALPALIQADPYLAEWNKTIFGNASTWAAADNVKYVADGGLTGSGILDVSRQVKERMKAWGYAWRLTNDTAWPNRAWSQLQDAAGNGTQDFGTAGDNWNSLHFLDVGEMTAAYAIAYDWMNDFWSDDQKNAIMWSILNLGLEKGLESYNGASFGWWATTFVDGNWNCVSNGGMVMGALAIIDDDPTGKAASVLTQAIPNALKNCVLGPSSDGTWAETANYWYFGTTGHAEMTSSLITATGGDYGLLSTNPSFNLTALYHMYVFGQTSLFNYGDHGPNKYSTTANSLIFYGSQYNIPMYTLYQRDHQDAAEPTAMFWYDPSVSGAWWAGLPLDHYFADPEDGWASMRTSWTDNTGVYVAMKAGKALGHQTHGDLDQGDFVLDAMGQRWAGELGSGDYLSPGYFSSEEQDSQRWLYYRKRTEGQNTLLIGELNQNVACDPTTNFATTGEKQSGGTTVYSVPGSSTALFTADMTSAYNETTSVKRGIRLINGRKQVLLQDDINTSAAVQWRMHTNATVTLNGNSATLKLGGKEMTVQILSPANAVFSVQDAVRLPNDPALPSGASDQDNPGVTVLTIALDAGENSIQVLFNPQWPGMSASSFKTPPSVGLDSWTLTSHN